MPTINIKAAAIGRMGLCAAALAFAMAAKGQDIVTDTLGTDAADVRTEMPAVLPTQAESADAVTQGKDRGDDEVWKKRRKYFNLGYHTGSLKPAGHDGYECGSEMGFGLDIGRTWYLHKRPIAGLMKVGLDATFLSVSYDKLDEVDYPDNLFGIVMDGGDGMMDELDEMVEIGNHRIDVGVHVGPSLTINPVSRLMLRAYFHYCPTYSMLLIDEEFCGNYASLFTYGLSVSYGVIGVGVEHRFGSGNYECNAYLPISDFNDKTKLKTSAVNFYISFKL